jgi:2'-5' RNA ligase
MGRREHTRGLKQAAAPPRHAAPESRAATIRCFVALQPDEAARERLDVIAGEWQARLPGARRMRRDNLHLTLAFIGALEADRAGEVAAHLAALPQAPFDWTVDAVGAFGGARVLWAGGSDPRLDALAARVRALLDELGVRFDRKPFVAHVTLLRKLPREAAREAGGAIEPPLRWQAGAAVLLESRSGAEGTRYVPVVPARNG